MELSSFESSLGASNQALELQLEPWSFKSRRGTSKRALGLQIEPSGENEGLEQAGRRKAEKRSGHKNVENLIEKRLFGRVLGAV